MLMCSGWYPRLRWPTLVYTHLADQPAIRAVDVRTGARVADRQTPYRAAMRWVDDMRVLGYYQTDGTGAQVQWFAWTPTGDRFEALDVTKTPREWSATQEQRVRWTHEDGVSLDWPLVPLALTSTYLPPMQFRPAAPFFGVDAEWWTHGAEDTPDAPRAHEPMIIRQYGTEASRWVTQIAPYVVDMAWPLIGYGGHRQGCWMYHALLCQHTDVRFPRVLAGDPCGHPLIRHDAAGHLWIVHFGRIGQWEGAIAWQPDTPTAVPLGGAHFGGDVALDAGFDETGQLVTVTQTAFGEIKVQHATEHPEWLTTTAPGPLPPTDPILPDPVLPSAGRRVLFGMFYRDSDKYQPDNPACPGNVSVIVEPACIPPEPDAKTGIRPKMIISPDCLFSARTEWATVDGIYLAAESEGNDPHRIGQIKRMCEQFADHFDLPRKPFLAYTGATVLPDLDVDWLGVQLYLTGAQGPEDLRQLAARQLAPVAHRQVILIGQCYDRRTGHGAATATYTGGLAALMPVYWNLVCAHANVVGLLLFSDGRPGGARDHPEVYPWLRAMARAAMMI